MQVLVPPALLVWLLALVPTEVLVWRLPQGPLVMVMQQRVLREPMLQSLQGWRLWAHPGFWLRGQALP